MSNDGTDFQSTDTYRFSPSPRRKGCSLLAASGGAGAEAQHKGRYLQLGGHEKDHKCNDAGEETQALLTPIPQLDVIRIQMARYRKLDNNRHRSAASRGVDNNHQNSHRRQFLHSPTPPYSRQRTSTRINAEPESVPLVNLEREWQHHGQLCKAVAMRMGRHDSRSRSYLVLHGYRSRTQVMPSTSKALAMSNHAVWGIEGGRGGKWAMVWSVAGRPLTDQGHMGMRSSTAVSALSLEP
ncbi:hypothetical protein BDZ85DRAFT_304504 [Elsinoe ampelina]|uniref:Uncharacterized protein n=1 Tax=Elsinoe ampelina TaxID=302913 RepID=A0A6A6G1D2_9PEZI|nr:hypothetical protein BDZ85DRAFT_304504 [Elsinoe ampelina]